MAVDKLINETQGNDIIDRLDDIASNLENVAAIIPAKFGMGLATCDTAADTAAKTCTIPNFALTNGAPVSVKFTYSNSASNATLNINGTGAKPMYYKGNPLGSSVISAGDIATFVYSSTGVYHIINIDTLTGAGTGTVTQIGGTGGITTNQTSGAPIQHDGNVKLNLKSDTAYTGTVADPSTDASITNGNVYPVALDGDGHPVVGVPWTDTTYENKSASEGGTDVSLVTTGDKYVWDHKLDATANAASAAKLNNGSADYAVGSATKGVYFNNGVPTVMTYELNTNVPADAVFTDTIYTGTGAIGVDADTHVISAATATTTTAGVVTLSDAIPSSGAVDTKAATEKAVADSISGKAIGANSSTANAIATFSGTDGKTLADSAVTIAKNATGVTDDDTKVPTSKAVKTYVDATATGISRYLGTIDAVNELSTSAKKGDFYIVSTAWTGVHIGDEIIAEKNSPAQTIDGTNWKLLHNEADTNTTYEFSSGTTNGSFNVTPSSTGTAQSVAVYGLKSAAYTDSTDYATSSHIHGSITNDGTITDTGVALAEGDSLAIVDSSDSSKIKKTSVTFDGSSTTKALTQAGSFETFLQSHQTVKQDGVTGATVNRFGTCSIAAGTAAKTVSITTGTFALEAGARVTVKFSNANTASSPTLNVDSTGAKNIFHNGAQITTGTNKGLLAGTVDFIYDGTQYHLIGNYIDTNTTYSDFVGSGSSSAHGLVPDPGSTAGTSRFLCENGEWATPEGGSGDDGIGVPLPLGSLRAKTKDYSTEAWMSTYWGTLGTLTGKYIWSDGKEIYYSDGSTQYVLDRSNNSWTEKTWTGLTSFSGDKVWSDGFDIFYSEGQTQKILDIATSYWSTKSWTGLSGFSGEYIWTDGANMYYSDGSNNCKYDRGQGSWSGGIFGVTLYGNNIWNDGENTYYSYGTTQYVLNKSASTWSSKTWSGLTNFYGKYIWTDGKHTYYSNSSTQYMLNKPTNQWVSKSWGSTIESGEYVWTDGINVYYSYSTYQYILNRNKDANAYDALGYVDTTRIIGIKKNSSTISPVNGIVDIGSVATSDTNTTYSIATDTDLGYVKLTGSNGVTTYAQPYGINTAAYKSNTYFHRTADGQGSMTSGSLDDITISGTRYCTSSVTGGPVSSVAMMVETNYYSSSYKTQTATILSGTYTGCVYMRYYESSTWSIWYRNLGVGSPYISNANMNNFTTSGTYYCGTSSTNGPMSNVASILEVVRGHDNYIIQRCTVLTSGIRQNVTYQRIRNNGTWYKWGFYGPNFSDYKILAADVTWTKSGSGLYYYSVDLASSWELIMSATIASWQSIKNYGLSCSITGTGSTCKVGIMCCVPDGSAPSFVSGSEIWVRLVGYMKPTT